MNVRLSQIETQKDQNIDQYFENEKFEVILGNMSKLERDQIKE